MFRLADNFYARWRLQSGAVSVLRDDADFPPERLLQAIWQHQRLQRDRLQTADGRNVRVLHPGFISVEGGPDFRGAVLQIGDAVPCSGDVEIDLRANGWHAHAHDRNPAFQNVLLHVVWDDVGVHAAACRNREMSNPPKPGLQPAPPTLAISEKLDASIAELGLRLEHESPRVLPENCRGKCSAGLRELDETRIGELLSGAALVRFQAKAAHFHARARQVGWEQALWEGLFRALGYKHNAWPMQNLAETRRQWARPGDDAFTLQARLLGISGLLPGELPRASAKTGAYLRRVWDLWWRERDEFGDCTLPRTLWRFHGLRPANHPQRRLALAAHWLAAENLASRLEGWCAADLPDAALLDSLLNLLQAGRDEFWSWHWTFHSARLKKSQPLLGAARVTDLAVNVILPWLWVRAAEGGNEPFQRVIEHRYFAWRAVEDNAVLRLARQRLFGVGKSPVPGRAAAQQGLTQIVRDFCEHSNAICERCRFPELVTGWNPPAATGFRPARADCS